jgi:hypothetical protein
MTSNDIENYIDKFVDNLDFDDLRPWCAILDVEYEEPQLDDLWPDWEGEIREKIAFALWDIYEPTKKYTILVKSHTELPDFEASVRSSSKAEAKKYFSTLNTLREVEIEDYMIEEE